MDEGPNRQTKMHLVHGQAIHVTEIVQLVRGHKATHVPSANRIVVVPPTIPPKTNERLIRRPIEVIHPGHHRESWHRSWSRNWWHGHKFIEEGQKWDEEGNPAWSIKNQRLPRLKKTKNESTTGVTLKNRTSEDARPEPHKRAAQNKPVARKRQPKAGRNDVDDASSDQGKETGQATAERERPGHTQATGLRTTRNARWSRVDKSTHGLQNCEDQQATRRSVTKPTMRAKRSTECAQ